MISENLEMYTAVPRLDAQSSAFYEPPLLRESFLTNKPQSMPKLRVQFLKQASIKDLGAAHARGGGDRVIDLPQGWSEAIDVSHIGKATYNLPGNYRLHVEVERKTSFLMHVVFRDTFSEKDRSEEIEKTSSKAEIKVCIGFKFFVYIYLCIFSGSRSCLVMVSTIFRLHEVHTQKRHRPVTACCTSLYSDYMKYFEKNDPLYSDYMKYFEVTLGLRYIGVTLGLHRGLGSHRGYIGVSLRLHRRLGLHGGCIGVALVLRWGYIGVTLGIHWGYIGVTLGLLWGYIGVT